LTLNLKLAAMRLTPYLMCIISLLGGLHVSQCFTNSFSKSRRGSFIRLNGESKSSGDENEAWDANVDYDKEWPQEEAPPDPSTAWDALPSMPEAPKLGIDLDLQPLNEEQAAALKKEAEEIINSRIDEGIQDIEKLREKMAKEMEKSRKMMQLSSEMEAKKISDDLLKKIDKMTDSFLSTTEGSRKSTKMAAAASKAMEGTGQGIEMGTWGTISGRTVIASGSGSLLGSIENAVKEQEKTSKSSKTETTTTEMAPAENRILVIADMKQDQIAKQLVPELEKRFAATDIPNCAVEVLSPSASMPLGGNNAACVLVFCPSLSQSSSLTKILDRLLRKTFQADGVLGRPPTQLVGISTLGTERSDKFPYSVANLLGKLDQRRQVEEVLINTVQGRESDPPLDFTLVKVGDLKGSAKEFCLRPGDALDDPTTAETAARAIVQAVAYQPFARNSTLSISGTVPGNIDDATDETFWNTAFLCLEGPEVLRVEGVGDSALHGKLVEYIQGWAKMLAETGKGLTTPVQSVNGIESRSSHLVKEQDGVQLLFLPTKTGKYYMSREEERKRESVTGRTAGTAKDAPPFRKNVREGGIDVVVEVTNDDKLRVRARRCNYAYDAVIKELSESTILGRLEDAMEVWKRELP